MFGQAWEGEGEGEGGSQRHIPLVLARVFALVAAELMRCSMPWLSVLQAGPIVGRTYENSFKVADGTYILACMLTCRLARITSEGEESTEEQMVDLVQPAGNCPHFEPEHLKVCPGKIRIRIRNELGHITRVFLLPEQVAKPFTPLLAFAPASAICPQWRQHRHTVPH